MPLWSRILLETRLAVMTLLNKEEYIVEMKCRNGPEKLNLRRTNCSQWKLTLSIGEAEHSWESQSEFDVFLVECSAYWLECFASTQYFLGVICKH